MTQSGFALARLIKRGGSAVSIVAATLAMAPAALAQDSSTEDGGDDAASPAIIVTGSRLREEAVQDVPLAASVLNPVQIDALQNKAVDVRALSAVVPNLLIEPVGSSPGTAAISLRGFNTRTSDVAPEPGIAVYVDGIYQVINTGQQIDLYDLDRIEVLRGPQGTLLGKNAGAGAILVTRARPKFDFSGKVRVEYGNYNLRQAQALVNVPIVPDVLAAKVFASVRKRDGYIKNLEAGFPDQGGQDIATFRGALLFQPTSDIEIYASADYIRDRSQPMPGRNVSGPDSLGCIVFAVCAPHAGQWAVTNATLTDDIKTDDHNYVLDAKFDLGGVRLQSLTGYRTFEQVNNVDLDSVPELIIQVPGELKELDQFSQEIRLSSKQNGGLDLDGRLAWLIAGYYGKSTSDGTLPLTAFGSTTTQSQVFKRESWAVFTHIDFDILDSLTLNFGARYSEDRIDHAFSLRQPGTGKIPTPYDEKAKFDNTSFEGGVQYRIDPNKMVYFRYAEGYRGGTFVGLPASLDATALVQPEISTSYEVGLKSDWLDGALRVNLTLFDVKYKNLQRDIVFKGADNTFIQATANAADATTKGVELETIITPSNNLQARINFGYLDAQYNRYISFDPTTGAQLDLSGQPLTYAPEFTVSANLDYTVPLEGSFESLKFSAGVDQRSDYQTSATANPVGAIDGFFLVNGSVTLAHTSGLSVSVYGQNLFDHRFSYLREDVGGLILHAVDDLGRSYGVAATFRF
jgi:iron complex outermembrane recepter protein